MKLAKGRQQTKPNVTSYILQGLLRIVASDGCVTSIFEKTCPNYSWNIGGNVCEINPFIYDKWYGPIYQRLCKNPTANLQKVSSSSAFVPLKVVWDHPAGREDLMFRSKPFCNRFVVGLADWGSCVRGVNVLVWLASGYKTGFPLLFLLVHVGHCSLHTSVCLH